MRLPVSGILAEIKLRSLEKAILRKYKCYIKNWFCYVDDVFAVISGIEPSKLLTLLNEMDQNIKFTFQIERNNTLNYLDVKIIRVNNKIETAVY